MQRLLAGKMISLIILMIVLFGITGGLQAQDASPEFAPAFLMNTSEGIVFYGVNLENEVAELGRLPDNIGIFDPDRSYEWEIDARENFVLSPNHQYMAFVAHKNDESGGAVFIFHFKNQNLETLNTTIDAQCEGLYLPLRISWSPDSDIVMATPALCNEAVFYRLSDKKRLSLPKLSIFGYWEKDSGTLLYADAPEVYLLDTRTLLEIPLATFENVNMPRLASPPVPICDFVWSEPLQTWFYVSGCIRSMDYTMDYLYSVNLEGNIHLEVALPDFYSAIFPRTETVSSYQYVNIHSLIAADSDVYVVVELGLPEGTYSSILQYGSIFGGQARPREIFGAYTDYLSQVVFSPNLQNIALLNYEGNIKIINLRSDTLIEEIIGGKYDAEGVSYTGLWLDDSRLVYNRTDEGVGIFYWGTADRTDINLAAGLSGEAFVFRQTNS